MSDCDLLVLAPHLDDGPFSCGGSLHKRAARGERVRVVTVFAGDPPADEAPSDLACRLHAAMGLSGREAMAVRRQEDEAACRILGADWQHWSFCDALYRRTGAAGEEAPCYPTLASIFAPPGSGDEPLRAALTARLRALPVTELVLAPLAAGGHVDHRLLRQAAQEVWGAKLGFYEDVPYVLRPWPTGGRNLRRALGRRAAWRPMVEPLAAADLAAKLRAMAAYPTQVKPIFRAEHRMRQVVERYTRRIGGERRWYQAR